MLYQAYPKSLSPHWPFPIGNGHGWVDKPYSKIWQQQKDYIEEIAKGTRPSTVLMVEHDPVYTMGKRFGAEDSLHLLDQSQVVQIERGGEVTYHGPGQLVIYPLIKLNENGRDVHKFLRFLEFWIIDFLAQYGIIRYPR